MQELNKHFLRSSFGSIRSEIVSGVLEDGLSGINSYLVTKVPTGSANPSESIFPLEDLFSALQDALKLDFNNCFGLLDLSVEVQRQAMERKQLYEDFANPHPEVVFGKKKGLWFSQLMYERIGPDAYHVTYVSSERFNEVIIVRNSLSDMNMHRD